MKNLFIPYVIAKKLKEKDFDVNCIASYDEHKDNKLFYCDTEIINAFGGFTSKLIYRKDNYPCVLAPMYQQVIDWFRLKYNLHIEIQIDKTCEPKYCYEIYHYKDFGNWKLVSKRPEMFLHLNYYDNLNEAIKEAITLI